MAHNINWVFDNENYPPKIVFTDQIPQSRMSPQGTGFVHVKVTENQTLLPALSSDVILTSASVGEIDTNSIVIDNNVIQFDVINISASGDVIVSASDPFNFTSVESDGKWFIGNSDTLSESLINDRLINLVNFLPQHLVESEVFDFMEFFQEHLNTLYESNSCTGNTHISSLKKIERLSSLHDADTIDIEYIQFLSSFMGYDIDVNRADIGSFRFDLSEVDADDVNEEELCEFQLVENEYLRFVVRNLPNWYRIKTTNDSIRIALFSFGVVGQVRTMFTNDYNLNWFSEDKKDNVDISVEFGENRLDYFPSPHFIITVDVKLTPPQWTNNIGRVKNSVNLIRPINTVFDDISARYDMDTTMTMNTIVNTKVNENYYISWDKQTADL